MKMGPLCVRRGERGRRELTLSCLLWAQTAGLVETDVIPSQTPEPWRPEQPGGQEEASPPSLSCLSRPECTGGGMMGADLERLPVRSWLQGAKASLYHPTPGL